MTAEALIGKTPNLQSPSPAVVRLLNLLDNPNADYDEVITTISSDVVLSAKLLALCNSTTYGLAHQVASLEHGVLYLGLGEIHRLVMALSFGGQIGTELPGYDMEAVTLWQHSLVTALLTPRVLGLSQNLGSDTSIAYTAGLLHDIGKLVIGQTPDAAMREKIHQLVLTERCSLLQAETSVIGCNHAEIGACLLRRWRIPEIIVEAVANHHNPPLEEGPSLSAVVHVADATAHQIGSSPGWQSFAVVVHEAAMTALNLSASEIDALTFAALDCQHKVAQQAEIPGIKTPAPRLSRAARHSF